MGHPPYGSSEPFTIEEIEDYLLHRTFVGFTRERATAPRIHLSVLGKPKELALGFPELVLADRDKPETMLVNEQDAATANGTTLTVSAQLKGFLTWDQAEYGLARTRRNTGLILSVKGIPYFELDMAEYGSRSIITATPGRDKCCLIVECDGIQEEMNISRSALVNSERIDLLKAAVRKMIQRVESSARHLEFRQIPKGRKVMEGAEKLDERKKALESSSQPWVVYTPLGGRPVVLCRRPENENDVLSIVWKLEALGALPFQRFQTLGHMGTGPDLLVHFREDETSQPERYTCFEVENRFYNYKAHGHTPSQFVKVICWELGPSPKIPVSETNKRYKYTARKGDYQLHIYCLRNLETLSLRTREQLKEMGIEF